MVSVFTYPDVNTETIYISSWKFKDVSIASNRRVTERMK